MLYGKFKSMPELPEVETTRRGISPHILGKKITAVTIRNHSLRWPIPADLEQHIQHHPVKHVERRGKYLLFAIANGHLIIHLGMSGSLRVILNDELPQKHDHVDIHFNKKLLLRYNDPRRFGAILWTDEPLEENKLLRHLGPEPLTEHFTAEYVFARSRKHTQPIKSWIMDSKVVVGVGNIYANESLFNAGIHPLKSPQKISLRQYQKFVTEIKTVLAYAIERGGTTLKDFVGGDGKPGYFAQELNVYGRGGLPCKKCGKALTEKRVAQRTTVYCVKCQA